MILKIIDDFLEIKWEWYEQFFAFTWDKLMRIPLSHIKKVTINRPEIIWCELRAPGTFFPGLIKAGTYYTKNGKEFWYATEDKNFLILELEEEEYKRVILTIEGNRSWRERLNMEN